MRTIWAALLTFVFVACNIVGPDVGEEVFILRSITPSPGSTLQEEDKIDVTFSFSISRDRVCLGFAFLLDDGVSFPGISWGPTDGDGLIQLEDFTATIAEVIEGDELFHRGVGHTVTQIVFYVSKCSTGATPDDYYAEHLEFPWHAVNTKWRIAANYIVE